MQRLLPIFMLTLAAHGLSPNALDPWRGWMAFKEFARATHEVPDPGVSVQFSGAGRGREARLVFLRQATEDDDGWLSPTGAVVCEFTFASMRRHAHAWDRWSFDYADFERFVDIVEQEPAFQDLIVEHPVSSAVYWEEA